MATRLVEASGSGSFLLELLYFAGWRLDVRDGDAPRIRATRAEIELEAGPARVSLRRRGRSSRGRCAQAAATERAELVDELDILDGEWRRLEDDLRVLRWRSERLVALGYERREAALLAVSPVDIHELERLIGKGCPRETAVQIAA